MRTKISDWLWLGKGVWLVFSVVSFVSGMIVGGCIGGLL